MFGLIYIITCLVNGKYYVGQTVSTVRDRWKRHQYDAVRGAHHNAPDTVFYRAIRKYGRENFKVETLCECPNQKALDTSETFFIWILGSRIPSLGYNTLAGGRGRSGVPLTEEHKDNIRKGLLGKKRPDLSYPKNDEQKDAAAFGREVHKEEKLCKNPKAKLHRIEGRTNVVLSEDIIFKRVYVVAWAGCETPLKDRTFETYQQATSLYMEKMYEPSVRIERLTVLTEIKRMTDPKN